MFDRGKCTLVLLLASLSLSSSTPSQRCLDCICEASSGCKQNLRCHNTGAGQYYCGPYQISWAYWADGGKPGNTGFANDFEKCLVDKTCAESAIKGYMAKWASDCNRDGRVDCLDYAAIHKAGPTGCQQSWLLNSKYWSQFNQCYRDVGSSSSSFGSSSSYRPGTIYRPITAASDNIIEIPKPSIRTTNLVFSPNGDLTSAVSSAGGTSSRETITFPAPGGMLIHSSYSSRRSNYSRREFEETVSSSSGGTRSGEAISDAAFIRPARLHDASSSSYGSSAPIYRPGSGGRMVNILEEVIRHESPTTRITSVTYNEPAESSPVSSSSAGHPVESVARPRIVPSDCLDCLCHASSKCQLSKGCDGAYCGPYLLSWGYWADGGQPGGPLLDYPTCARNRTCAEEAVHGYMNKWQRDCNQDGQVDCVDFALIHKLGPHGCGRLQALEPTDYWKQFTECRQVAPGIVAAEVIEAERSPSERSIPTSNRVNEPIPSDDRSDGSSVRIAFNNREVVNIGPEDSRPSPSIEPAQPANINANIISRSPYINRPTAIVSAQSQPPAPRPEVRESLATVESVPDQLAPREVVPPTIVEEPIVTKPQPESTGLTEVILAPQSTNPVRSTSAVANNSSVTKECLECICHASSRCSNSIGCISNGRGKYNCGPYQVDWEYWTEAGKPGNRPDLSNLENFQMCLNNRECADQTVRAFLERQGKDCNDDGLIDCNDFAALHVAGPRACNAQWYTESKYYSDFRECYDF